MKSKTQQITVKVNEENPEPFEVLAQSIIEVAEAFKKIDSSRLKRRAIVLLLQDLSGCNQREINAVLDAGPKLQAYFTKELKKV